MSCVSRIFQPAFQLVPTAGILRATVQLLNAVISLLSKEILQESSAVKYPPICPNQFSEVTSIKFPAYSGLQCNMMPFIMGDKNSLPEQYQHYWDLVDACNVPAVERGKVGYLTISESFVKPNSTQRRPGVHVEKHPAGGWGGTGWGGGNNQGSGLYMASNIDQQHQKVWNCYVRKSLDIWEIAII